MKEPMMSTDQDREFGREVARYAARARRGRLFSYIVMGLFFALAAAAAYALVNDVIALPLRPLVFLAAVVACGIAASAAVALLSPLDPLPLLIRADKALANGELSSTAYGLDRGENESLFSAAIVEDAVRSLKGGDPAAIIGRPRMRLLPLLPAVLACAVLLSLFPFDLKAVFTPKPRLDPEIVGLGQDLESFGKTLEKRAEEEGLKRSLALSEELQQLGEDFQNQKIDQSEAERRLADIENRVAEEYDLRIRQFEVPAENPGKGEGEKSDAEGKNATDDAAQQDSEGQPSAESNRETRNLAETLDMLAEKRKNLGAHSPGTDPESRAAEAKDFGLGSGEGNANTAEQPVEDGREGTDPSAKPGTMAADIKHGEASNIESSTSGESLKADAQIGEGDLKSFMLRALPRRNGAVIPEKDLLGTYEKTAESALAGEEVPLGLREYVKNYFISLGMLGAGD
jgi:hypothetical protein